MNPILMTTSFTMGRHVHLYVGTFDVGIPMCQIRRESKNSWGVTVLPSVQLGPKTKLKTKSTTTARPSSPITPKAHGSVIQKSSGQRNKTVSGGFVPQNPPSLGTSHATVASSVGHKGASPPNSKPWPEVRTASKPVKSAQPGYAILPGDSQAFTLDDDQVMGYAVRGSDAPTAKIVYQFHGTPGSRLVGDLDNWGVMNNIRFICPERPGYGLSSVKRKYAVIEHAEHVYRLSKHLGHHKFTTYGTSGGAPYALALAHLASKNTVTGTVLVVPHTPPEAPYAGVPGWLSFHVKAMWFPAWAEREKDSGVWQKYRSRGDSYRLECNKIWRRSEKGRKALKIREADSEPAGHVSDWRALHKPTLAQSFQSLPQKSMMI